MNRQARIPEKVIQSQGVNLLRSVGAAVYPIGTRRPRGDFQGTCMAPGLADVWAFLPAPRVKPGRAMGLWWEAKADGGRLRPEQREFQKLCLLTGVEHVVGGIDALVQFLVGGGWLKAEGIAHYRQLAAESSPS